MLGPHRVTRLIVGSNPIYGYSHFNKQYDQHMLEWFTDERIVKLLLDCEKAGINTWQYSFNYDQKRQIPKIRAAGCKHPIHLPGRFLALRRKDGADAGSRSGWDHQMRASGGGVQTHRYRLPRRCHRPPLPGGENRSGQDLY